MKERYTTMRPYGEWLEQETVSLQQLVDSVPPELRVPLPVVPAAPVLLNGASSNGNRAAASVRAALLWSLLLPRGRLSEPAAV